MSRQLKEHARHAEELTQALEQAKEALGSQQQQALQDLQAHTQQQTADLEQRMAELQAQVSPIILGSIVLNVCHSKDISSGLTCSLLLSPFALCARKYRTPKAW